MSAEDNGELSFEEALSRLEAIVRELEAGRIKRVRTGGRPEKLLRKETSGSQIENRKNSRCPRWHAFADPAGQER